MRQGKDRLACFLYVLLRDYVTSGKIELIMEHHLNKNPDKEVVYSNYFMEQYAKDLLKRILSPVYLLRCSHCGYLTEKVEKAGAVCGKECDPPTSCPGKLELIVDDDIKPGESITNYMKR